MGFMDGHGTARGKEEKAHPMATSDMEAKDEVERRKGSDAREWETMVWGGKKDDRSRIRPTVQTDVHGAKQQRRKNRPPMHCGGWRKKTKGANKEPSDDPVPHRPFILPLSSSSACGNRRIPPRGRARTVPT